MTNARFCRNHKDSTQNLQENIILQQTLNTHTRCVPDLLPVRCPYVARTLPVRLAPDPPCPYVARTLPVRLAPEPLPCPYVARTLPVRRPYVKPTPFHSQRSFILKIYKTNLKMYFKKRKLHDFQYLTMNVTTYVSWLAAYCIIILPEQNYQMLAIKAMCLPWVIRKR